MRQPAAAAPIQHRGLHQPLNLHFPPEAVELHQEVVCPNCAHRHEIVGDLELEGRVVPLRINMAVTERRHIYRDETGKALGSVAYVPTSIGAVPEETEA